VNEEIVNIASYQVSPKDKISVRDNKKEQLRIKLAMSLAETRGFGDWVEVDVKNLKGVFTRMPERKELPSEINESLIVELYSK
jgi:small subunit ribosomal protein S4